jgi:phosphoserine aminotransferase
VTKRIYNFSSGPAVLPLPALEQAQRDLLALPGVGMSVMEISHRSQTFIDILEDAKARLKRLLKVPDNFQILFLQGGSRLQFSMIPMNLLRGSAAADYVLTGSWSKMARDEAVREGEVRVAWDGKATNYDRLPEPSELKLNPEAAYVYIASNETIQGVQFASEPETGGVPLVCDASSDFLHRPLPLEKYGLLYACAQKNAGPAGVTVVIIRDDLLAKSQDSLPGYLNFKNHAKENSLYNTPPTFAVYLLGLVAKWLEEDVGGLAKMHERNRHKAKLLYGLIDGSGGFYRGHALPANRSLMNVTFRLANDDLEKRFIKDAESRGLSGLAGHRSVGGMRASIYNAMPLAGVEALAEYMREFQKKA